MDPPSRHTPEPPSSHATLLPARSRRRRFNPRRAIRRVLAVTAVLIGLPLLALCSTWIGFRLTRAGGASVASPSGAAGQQQGVAMAAGAPIRVLLLGVDERPGDPGRADVVMVAGVDPGRKQVRLLSIPRDTWTNVPGRGWTKLNHAFAFGKERLARQAVEGLIGLEVDHHVVLNMDGFRRIVDLLGGVTVDVEKDMRYDDPYDDPPLHINLRRGRQRLDGERALHYVRFRSDGNGDAGRLRRQQAFLRALAAEAARPQNLAKLPSLISAAYRAVRTDLSLPDALRLALQLGPEAKEYAVEATALAGSDLWVDGVSYVQLDLFEARRLAHRVLAGGDPDEAFLTRARRDAQAHASAAGQWRDAAPPAAASPSGAARAATANGRDIPARNAAARNDASPNRGARTTTGNDAGPAPGTVAPSGPPLGAHPQAAPAIGKAPDRLPSARLPRRGDPPRSPRFAAKASRRARVSIALRNRPPPSANTDASAAGSAVVPLRHPSALRTPAAVRARNLALTARWAFLPR